MEDEHEATDCLSVRIDEKLSSFSTISSPICFKVPNLLRQTNEKAYEPQIISIGPYHHGKDHLKGMEAHKMYYLKTFLRRRGETSVHKYVMALKDKEEKIRKCYAEPLDHNIDGDALVEMMLLDGYFIIELFRENLTQTQKINELRGENDNFQDLNSLCLIRDLLLVENQLPFFVLWELFHMTREPNEENFEGFIHRALTFFFTVTPGCGNEIERSLVSSGQNITNLLSLVHDSWVPSPEARDNYSKNSAGYGVWNFTRNATELQEAGIKFKKTATGKSIFDIEFKNSVLWIPTIEMYDYTESILRNFIAHEQCYNNHPRYVTDYVTFMDCLINTRKDVELLRHSGIIVNGLGDDEFVATTFNWLCKSIVFSAENLYSEIFINVENHCEGKWNLWIANLKHNYFNTPWALISFLAAVFLLILTVAQTIYSLLSYYNTAKLFLRA